MRAKRRLGLLAPTGVIGLVIGLLACAGTFDRFEAFTSDLRFRLRGQRIAVPAVVMIGVQAKCMETEHCGPAPWDRRTWAEAVRKLKAAGAAVVVSDIFFADPSPDPASDAYLAEAFRQAGNVVLPVFASGDLKPVRDLQTALAANALQENVDVLQRSAAAIGHINVVRGADGVCRSVPVAIDVHGQRVWHLSAVAASLYLGDEAGPRIDDGKLLVGGRRFDLAQGRELPINFYGLYGNNVTAVFVPFRDLLEGRVPPGLLEGRLVVMGQTAAGLPSADVVTTPFGDAYGLMLQAEAMMTLVSGGGVRLWGDLQTILFLVIVGVLSGLLMGGNRLYWTLTGLPILLLLASVFAVGMFSVRCSMVPYVPLVAVIAGSFVMSLGIGYLRHSREAEQRRGALEDLQHAEALVNRLLAPNAEQRRVSPVAGSGRLAQERQIANAASDVVLHSMARAIGASGGYLYLKDREGHLNLAASYGPAAPPTAPQEGDFQHALADYHLGESRPLSLPDPRAPAAVAQDAPQDGLISVRLSLGDQFMGFIAFYGAPGRWPLSRRTRFSAQDLVLVVTMMPHMLVTLENARLHTEMQALWLESTRALVQAIEAKDPYTRGHSERVATYANTTAEDLDLQDAECQIIYLSAILHDVGKIGIAEGVLQKPAALSEDEYSLVKTHPDRGVEIIRPLAELDFLLAGIRHHHERFDGGGYPAGLAGEDIPLVARIISLPDAFDAMTSDRPYRPGMSTEVAIEIITREKGAQFDPGIADVFVALVRRSPRADEPGTER